MQRHPYAAYEALLEVIEDITRYEGRKSGELISERSVSNLMCELADEKHAPQQHLCQLFLCFSAAGSSGYGGHPHCAQD